MCRHAHRCTCHILLQRAWEVLSHGHSSALSSVPGADQGSRGAAEGLDVSSGPISPAPSYGRGLSSHRRTGSKGSIPYLSQALDHLTSTISLRFPRILGSGAESPERDSMLARNGGTDQEATRMPASPFALASPEPSSHLMWGSWDRSPTHSNGIGPAAPPSANGQAPSSLGNGAPVLQHGRGTCCGLPVERGMPACLRPCSCS